MADKPMANKPVVDDLLFYNPSGRNTLYMHTCTNTHIHMHTCVRAHTHTRCIYNLYLIYTGLHVAYIFRFVIHLFLTRSVRKLFSPKDHKYWFLCLLNWLVLSSFLLTLKNTAQDLIFLTVHSVLLNPCHILHSRIHPVRSLHTTCDPDHMT